MKRVLALALLALASVQADPGLGVSPGPLLSVMAGTGIGPQALVLLDTSERKLSAYTLDGQGRIVFAAMRPLLYDLSIPDEYPSADFPAPPASWKGIRKALFDRHHKDFAAFKEKRKGALFDEFLESQLKTSADQIQLMTASDASPGQPQLIEVLDRANQKLLVYRFTPQDGLEFLAMRNLAFDRKVADLTGKNAYLSVEAVRKGMRKHGDPEEP